MLIIISAWNGAIKEKKMYQWNSLCPLAIGYWQRRIAVSSASAGIGQTPYFNFQEFVLFLFGPREIYKEIR